MVIISLVFSVFTLIYSYFTSYGRETKKVEERYESIEVSLLQQVVYSVYNFDSYLTEIILDSITQNESSTYCYIIDPFDSAKTMYSSAGTLPEHVFDTHSFPLVYDDGDAVFELGTLVIVTDNDLIQKEILKSFIDVAINNVIMIFLVFLIMLYVIQNKIVKRLLELSAFTRKIDYENIDKITLFEEKTGKVDELDYLQNAFITLIERLKSGIVKQNVDEELIRSSLEEKEILLKEIHHRVKNNLQIVISLMNLQIYRVIDPVNKQMLVQTLLRIHSIAAVHEVVYETEYFSSINLKKVIISLSKYLQSHGDGNPISLSLEIDENIDIVLDLAVPVTLLLNEFLGAIIEALSERHFSGIIHVKGRIVDNQVVFDLHPDCALPGLTGWLEQKDELRYQLMNSIIEQITGEFTISEEGSLSFTFALHTGKQEK